MVTQTKTILEATDQEIERRRASVAMLEERLLDTEFNLRVEKGVLEYLEGFRSEVIAEFGTGGFSGLQLTHHISAQDGYETLSRAAKLSGYSTASVCRLAKAGTVRTTDAPPGGKARLLYHVQDLIDVKSRYRLCAK